MRVPRVGLGISGGIDSAVSAYLLKKKGYDVVAVNMINWDPREEGTSHCDRSHDEAVAKRACQHLDIPFHSVNFVQQYWNQVFSQMVDNYRLGRTVVPDIACNRHIKFDHFHKFCRETLNADYIATGHYASTSREELGDLAEIPEDQKVDLLQAKDPLKDQTFFLCTLDQAQLRRSLFPLRNITKNEVYEIARREGLNEVAEKKEGNLQK
ncbi:unnamed protein product, partial [Mesorhabditis spiculigera]